MSRLFTRVAALATLTLGLISTTNAAGSAVNYTGTLCTDFVDYQVWVPANVTIALIEQDLTNKGFTKDRLGLLRDPCYTSLLQLACSSAFPRVVPTTKPNEFDVRFACKSTCQTANSQCLATLTAAGMGSVLPDCNNVIPGTVSSAAPSGIIYQPDGSCNVVKSISNPGGAGGDGHGAGNHTAAGCPPPFITDTMLGPGGTTTNARVCAAGCCLPCPAQYSLYRDNVLENGFRITNIIRGISMVFSFVLMASYIFLPDKRSHPSALILFFSICVFLFSVVVLFPLIDTRAMQCADAINPSTQQNNLKCAIQGAMLIFASVGTCAWCTALIINLHLHTVWNSAWFAKKYWLIHLICWGFATSVTAAALGMGEVRWEFATLCLISQEKSSTMFFYPMAAMIFPAFLIHVATFIHIARISAQAGVDSETMSRSTLSAGAAAVISHRRHVMLAIKIQWRAAVMAVFAILSVMFYWLFYFLQLSKTKPENLMPHVMTFFGCLAKGGSHDVCADMIAPFLPPYAIMMAAEGVVSFIGTLIFIVFFKSALIREWGDWFGSVGYLLSGKRREKKEQDQFFVI
ncbi:hypothetical protein BGZ76_011295 [Entomortierella beljakovae]|nr:hypothetical protein BGZ76_011295 [Entomortierella beljakovae]